MATGCPLLDSEFVARQNGKKLPCERLAEENSKLRDEFSKMDEWHSKELLAAIDENKRLRELVKSMYYDLSNQTFPPDWVSDYKADMRELGVEVDE